MGGKRSGEAGRAGCQEAMGAGRAGVPIINGKGARIEERGAGELGVLTIKGRGKRGRGAGRAGWGQGKRELGSREEG